MPEPDDPISQARQGGIWLVGLSGAAIGGALAKLDWLIKFPPSAKIAFFVAFIGFLVSIYFGVCYVGQLLPLKQLVQKRKDAEAEHKDQAEIDKIKQQIKNANTKSDFFHYSAIIPFLVSCIAVLVCLNTLLFKPWDIERPPLPPVPPNKYLITNVPVHVHGRLTHSHTLLLNQQTGEIWELTCENGKIIAFRSVPVAPH
ncbi:MAG: hypothetical protein LAO56_13760 [Acidobacteriia bacterium]|nr:hypothetical protein [Terriglobia bacterium]